MKLIMWWSKIKDSQRMRIGLSSHSVIWEIMQPLNWSLKVKANHRVSSIRLKESQTLMRTQIIQWDDSKKAYFSVFEALITSLA